MPGAIEKDSALLFCFAMSHEFFFGAGFRGNLLLTLCLAAVASKYEGKECRFSMVSYHPMVGDLLGIRPNL